ncbi:MAG: hypothetical protein U0264_16375 [Candidatus Kapaibacterium sp.]
MKHSFFAMVIVVVCALAACKDTTSPAPTTPTYKYSFTGKISNPKNITIPDDAYLVTAWSVSRGSPDYGYYFGEGHLDKSTNSFTVGFNADLPSEAMNLNSAMDGGLGVGYVLLVTSPTKLTGKDLKLLTNATLWGAMDWSGMIYIGGEPSKVEWRPWGKDFKQGYNYAVGVDNPSGFDSYAPADSKNMTLLIDTSLAAFKFPNWTGKNPDKNSSK